MILTAVLALSMASATAAAAAEEPGEGFAGDGVDPDWVVVDTSIGLPVVLSEAETVGLDEASEQSLAEQKAASVTRELDAADLEVLAAAEGPRIMTWDVQRNVITDVAFRETPSEPVMSPFYLAPGIGCSDNAAYTSCIFRTTGNRTVAGRNDTTNPLWSSTNSTMYAAPRSIKSQICAGVSQIGNCQALPPDFYMQFLNGPETITQITHF